MDKFRILIVGCGEVGSALAQLLTPKHQVYGLRRNIDKLPPTINAIAADFLNPSTLNTLPNIDILVYCAAPTRGADDNYQATYIDGFNNVLKALPAPPSHIFFTSSTSVYGQNQHQWVNEESLTQPLAKRANIMLSAEQQVLSSQIPATVVRFSGIYGFDRLFLLKQVLNNQASADLSLSYTNRIHLEDCAGVLNHLIERRFAKQHIAKLYLASDNKPAPRAEVLQWLAQQTNSQLSDVPSRHKVNSKRCDNRLLLETNYQFIYPDYKAGYSAIIKKLQLTD